jgi:tetratricopeptide (TPR) repeat protein
VNEALVIAQRLSLPSLAADALRTSAWVIDRRGDRPAAKGCAAEAVEMALAGGDTHLIARAYDVRGAMAHGDNPAQARADYSEALRYCESTGDRQGQATTLNNLAVLELDQGAHAAARRYFDEALALVEGVGDPALTPFIHYGVGLTLILDEDYDSAQRSLAEALRESGRTGQPSLEAYALLGTAIARARSSPDLLAAQLLGAAQVMFDRLRERPEPTEAALCDQARSALTTALGDDLEMALTRGRSLPAAESVRLAAEACRGPAGML